MTTKEKPGNMGICNRAKNITNNQLKERYHILMVLSRGKHDFFY